MNVATIYGTPRKETTYHMTNLFLSHFLQPGDRLTRFVLPRDMPHFCTGCGVCFTDERRCPHRRYIGPIEKALDQADLIVLASPVYVLHASAQMKALLDHFGYRFLVHRPEGRMLRTQGLVITQAAGGGTRSAAEDMSDSLDMWGVGRRYEYRANVYAAGWDGVAGWRKKRISGQLGKLAREIREERDLGPDAQAKAMFESFRLMHKLLRFSEADDRYWKEQGWLGPVRPWK